MKKIFLMLFALTIALQAYSTDVLKGQILLNGEEINAEFVKLSSTTVALGTGYDACIPQYSQGRLCIPGQVKIGGTTYTVTKINNMAFRFCTELAFVDIENGVTQIGNFAFQGCTGLKEVDLPSTLTSIGTGAFIDLHLLRVKSEAVIPPVWEYNDVFKFHEGGISDTHPYYLGAIHLTVPKNAEESYRQALYTKPELGWTTPDGWGSLSGIGDAFFDSYHIYTPADLNALRTYCDGESERDGEKIKRVFLEDDIDMSGITWTTGIGIADYEFQGSFFGQGHTISNLTIVGDNPENHGGGAGLFGVFGGERISNLRLKNCRFSHPNFAGALIAYATTSSVNYNYHTDIDSVYVEDCTVESNGNVGGLVGSSFTTLGINNCYIGAIVGPYTIGVTPSSRGSVVGKGYKTTIRNCAVPIYSFSDSSYGPFVGILQNQEGFCDVDSCYTFETRNTGSFANAVRYYLGENLVYSGDAWDFWRGNTSYPQTFAEESMKGFILVPYLGTEKWAYKFGERAVPECFASKWEPEVNKFIICPAGKGILNGLTPTEEIPMKAWHTDDNNLAFHNYDFTTSRLWFDENLNPDVMDHPNQLPLGMATITSTGGVEYGRVLQAKDLGPHTYKEPIYRVDEQGNIIEEMEDSITITSGRDYSPIGYSVYLPYRLNMSPFCKLYQPQSVTTIDGVTTIHFRLLDTEYIEPFTPYYIVVEAETFPLSTEAETYFPKIGNTDISLGAYTFKGTNKSISNYFAGGNYILQSDGKWHLVESDGNSNVYIPAFRSFFSANGNHVNELRMIFDDDATSINEMPSNNWKDGDVYDLSGRRVTNPTKGVYIIGGRKVLLQ